MLINANMYFIILSYYNEHKNIQDIQIFGLYRTQTAAEKALIQYNKNFSFSSFLAHKNLHSNMDNLIYDTYPPTEFSESNDELHYYKYKFIITNYKHIHNKEFSFLPYVDDTDI